MIGILLSSGELKRLKRYHIEGSHEGKGYLPLADRCKTDLFFYSPSRIETGKQAKGFVYSYRTGEISAQTVPLPRVNLYRNTAYIRRRKTKQTINELRESRQVRFFNVCFNGMRNKLKNNLYLQSLPHIRSHIPETAQLSLANLEKFLKQFGKVIVKPVIGSKGRKITVIEQSGQGYFLHETLSGKQVKRAEKPKQRFISEGQLRTYFRQRYSRPAVYLVQRWIPLLRHQQKPFDLRIVVQKNKRHQWQMTSCIARVSPEPWMITNLNQGGETVSLKELRLNKKKRAIRKVCMKIAQEFEKLYPDTAEIGIDLAIDQGGKIWFLECNFCPHKEKWSTIYRIPFEHAYTHIQK